MGKTYDLGCRCGLVRIGVSVPGRSSGTRVKCYCVDCQTGALALDAGDMLDPAGGTDVWQTTPDLLTVQAGAEHLAILRLSPRGLYRWYAACCDTPLCNTLPKLGLPFVGLVLRPYEGAGLDKVFGPLRAQVNTVGARPGQGAPVKDRNFAGAGVQVVTRMILAGVSGRGRLNPLRDDAGQPIAPIRVLTREERHAAHP